MDIQKHRQDKMKYQKSEKGKKKHNAANKRYKKTTKGKIANKKYNKKRSLARKKKREKLYIKQNGHCAICNKVISFDKICYDHNHKTGIYRELLCCRCNTFVGFIEKSPGLVSLIFEYLKKHN
jgi:hypothetical protein